MSRRDGRYGLVRAELERALRSPSPELLRGQLLPAFSGPSPGMRVVLLPGSPYERLGLRSGDVLTRVNGVELTSVSQALEAYQGALSARRIDVELARGGHHLTQTYVVE